VISKNFLGYTQTPTKREGLPGGEKEERGGEEERRVKGAGGEGKGGERSAHPEMSDLPP
jgi:hypothetical protein